VSLFTFQFAGELRKYTKLDFEHLKTFADIIKKDIDELQWDTTAYNVGMRGIV
jgi:hypothetical protein